MCAYKHKIFQSNSNVIQGAVRILRVKWQRWLRTEPVVQRNWRRRKFFWTK